MIYRRLLNPVLAKALLLSLLGVAFSNGRKGVRFVGNGASSLCERNR